MLRTEVTVGGCCWAVEPTIRRSLFYEVNAKILCFCGREVIRRFLLAARCTAAPPIMLATFRQLAASFFTQLAGGDPYVAVWRLPVCGRAQHGSLPVGPRACRSVSRSQSRCAIARCYSDPHTVGSGVSRLPVTAAFLVECIRFSAICASAPAFRSIGDNRARFGCASCPRCE